MKSKIDVLVSRLDAYQARMDSHHEIMATVIDFLGKTEARMKSGQEEIEAEIKPDAEEMNTTGFEASPEEIEPVAEHQEVPNEEAALETIRIREDRSGDQRPTVGSRNPLKRRTNDNVVQGTLKDRRSGRDVGHSRNAIMA
jgi:hypothetical protein